MMAKVMPNPVSREPAAARQSSLPRLRYSFGVLIRYLRRRVSEQESTYTKKEEKRKKEARRRAAARRMKYLGCTGEKYLASSSRASSPSSRDL